MSWLLIDGNNIAYRSDAVLNLSVGTTRVSAIYGMLTTLRHLLLRFEPAKIVVAWDHGKSKFRCKLYPEYKSHRDLDDEVRKEQKRVLFEQIERIKAILTLLGIPQAEIPGVEADDIIAVLSRELQGQKVIVSNDRDFLQLVREDVAVYFPTDRVYLDAAAMTDEKEVAKVKREYAGLTPRQVLMFRMLTGDKSDNISGVGGVGDRTARRLVELAGNCNPAELFDKLTAHKGRLNYREVLATLPESEAILHRNRVLMDLTYALHKKTQQILPRLNLQRMPCDEDLLRKYFFKLKFASFLKEFDTWFDPFRRQE